MTPPPLRFDSQGEELRFWRGLVHAIQSADALLEDCLAKRLGLSAAVDVFLSHSARMIHADAGLVRLLGTDGPVLTRQLGRFVAPVEELLQTPGPHALDDGHTLFVNRLSLGELPLGTYALSLPGHFSDGGAQVMALVDALGEQLDSALLGFLALSEGRGPLERLDELSERTAFRPHARIGNYELLGPLGAGGMGQVMVARSVGPGGVGRVVALKRILPELCADPDLVQQFLDEARIGLRLSHPNLVSVYDFGEVAGAYYLAMELVRGVDLGRVLDSPIGALPLPLASTVMVQSLAGLHAAHTLRAEDGGALNLVHRDLSPSNLMVGFDGRMKVLDFGVAKMRLQRTVTLPGVVKGKALYMSPEQAVGDPVDARSDLFAMGLVLYEALTRVQPFWREKEDETMQAIVSDEAPRHPLIPEQVWRVIERALRKDRTQRFASAVEMSEALARAVPPEGEAELGRAVAVHFPDWLRELRGWDVTEPGSAAGVAKAKTRVSRAIR